MSSSDTPREMKIADDELAAFEHRDDPAAETHRVVGAQIWRTFKALGSQGGHILATGDGCGTLLGLPDGDEYYGSVIAHVDRHDNAVGPISDMNHWDELEDFDAVIATLGGYDVRLTYTPNIVRRRADQITDATLAVAVTKPGGLIAVVATHDLMDSPAPFGRQQIAGLADLIGAVRFPAGVYRKGPGVDEVADLLVFRRRESDAPQRGAAWEVAAPVQLGEAAVYRNTYFDPRPDQALGSTLLDPNGGPPTNLTVVGSKTLFPGLLTGALNNVIDEGRREGLTTSTTGPNLDRGFTVKGQARATPVRGPHDPRRRTTPGVDRLPLF